MAQLETQDLTQAVIDRMSECKDLRFKEVMSALVRHAHAFADEVQLRPDEWMTAIEFLTATGQMCDTKRQEFILLSDTLGLSMRVVAIAQAKGAANLKQHPDAARPTEATVQGPFFCEGAPQLPLGADLAAGIPGEPTYYQGRVTDTQGAPVAGCTVDVWSSDDEGFYDVQKGADVGMHLRAQFRTDANGAYRFWSIKPSLYPVPVDGPVGTMLLKMGRHPYRPGHMHMMLNAPGYESLTTHIFVSDSEYLDSDAVFGVRNSLIVEFKDHPPGKAPDGRMMETAYLTADYNFSLVPSA